jgi:hypothetical protein
VGGHHSKDPQYSMVINDELVITKSNEHAVSPIETQFKERGYLAQELIKPSKPPKIGFLEKQAYIFGNRNQAQT